MRLLKFEELPLGTHSPPGRSLQRDCRGEESSRVSPAPSCLGFGADPRLTGPVVPCLQDLYVAEALSTLESWRSRYNQVVKDKGDLELEIIVLNEYVCLGGSAWADGGKRWAGSLSGGWGPRWAEVWRRQRGLWRLLCSQSASKPVPVPGPSWVPVCTAWEPGTETLAPSFLFWGGRSSCGPTCLLSVVCPALGRSEEEAKMA